MPESLKLEFEAIAEATPGPRWAALCERTWPEYREWFLKEGDGRRPGYLTCRTALETHMPELVPTWETLVGLAGGGDLAARLLSLYCPTPYLVGCTQALVSHGEPVLIRNYDYHPAYCEGVFLMSQWHGTRVIVSSDCLWGALDGMNEHGLATTLAFGGRRVVGDGFGMPLILRYVLEFCRTVDEAVAVLRRIPSHMAYTVGLLDRSGAYATVYVGPDRDTQVLDTRVSTNHQGEVEWPEFAELTETELRAAFLEEILARPGVGADDIVRQFLGPPVASRDWRRAFGTLYTAAYWPHSGRVDFHWPHLTLTQRFDEFVETAALVTYVHEPPIH